MSALLQRATSPENLKAIRKEVAVAREVTAHADGGLRSDLGETGGQRKGLLLSSSRELLDGRPQVLVLGAHALPPRDWPHHVVQTPALTHIQVSELPSSWEDAAVCNMRGAASVARRNRGARHLEGVNCWPRLGVIKVLGVRKTS